MELISRRGCHTPAVFTRCSKCRIKPKKERHFPNFRVRRSSQTENIKCLLRGEERSQDYEGDLLQSFFYQILTRTRVMTQQLKQWKI